MRSVAGMAELPPSFAGVSPDAELLPGLYSIELEAPDAILDAIATRPTWRHHVESEIRRRGASAEIRIVGAGVQHNSPTERVFAIAFEVRDPADDGAVAVAAVPVVPVAILVAAIATALAVSMDRAYKIRRIDAGYDPEPPGTVDALVKLTSLLLIGVLTWSGVRLFSESSS